MQTYDKTKYRRLSSKDKVKIGDYYWSTDHHEFIAHVSCKVIYKDSFDIGRPANWNKQIYYYRERKQST